jgi:signal transduction histidine kinase
VRTMAGRDACPYALGMSRSRYGTATLTAARQRIATVPWAVALLSVCVFASLAWRLGASDGGARFWWALAAGAMTAAVAWRQRHPAGTWMIVTAGCALLVALMPGQHSAGVQVPLLVFAAPPVALYSLTAGASRRRGRTALVISAFALGGALSGAYFVGARPVAAAGRRCVAGPVLRCVTVSGGPAPGASRLAGLQLVLIILAVLVAAWALGERARASGEAAAALAERSAALDAERAGRERAAAAGERARIAAELHDITAHHISVVALQAGAARMLAESGQVPDTVLLRGIEQASRQAMTEIREALGVVRSSPDGPVPVPGTGQLPELARRLATAGLAVTFEGSAGSLTGQLDLAVYRVVQESLSNVLRHSAAGSAAVRLRRQGGELEVVVTDDGPACERLAAPAPRGIGAAEPGGLGLIGLRERVRRLGGQLRAGARPDGGFEVRACLPAPEAGPAAGSGQPGLRQADLSARAAQ